MPLQIRRGTDTERLLLAVPLANGELLWTTDTKKLFVGDGNTLAKDLTAVINYNDTDAQRAAGTLLAGSTTTDITFTYNTSLNTLTTAVDISAFRQNIDMNGFSLTGSGNINIDGDVRATGKLVGNYSGSLFGDDSTLLVDGVNSVIVGPINSSNIRGTFIGTVIGDVDGYHTGDVKGSIFADDSTTLVNAVSNIIGNQTTSFEGSRFNTDNDLTFLSGNSTDHYNFRAVNGGGLYSTLNIDGTNNSLTSPSNTAPGEFISKLQSRGYYNGVYKPVGQLIFRWSAGADLTNSNPGSETAILTNNNAGGNNIAWLDDKGTWTASTLKTGSYTTGNEPSSPTAGMIVFDSTLQKFKGYVDDTGLAGGGASNSTPGWILLN